MATTTPNYGLIKPASTDNYDITGFCNANMDKIDTQLKKSSDAAITGATFDSTVVPVQNQQLQIPMPNANQVGVSNPNLLINGDMRIAPHQSSLGYQYVIDRWLSNWPSNHGLVACTRKYSGEHFFLESIVQSVIDTGSMYHDLIQILEDQDNGYSALSGKTVTFSAQVNCTGDYSSLAIKYLDSNNTQYTASKQIPKDFQGLISVTARLPTNIHRIFVGLFCTRFLTEADVGTYHNILDAKLEIGSIATPLYPRSYAEELAMCRRYFCLLPYCNIRAVQTSTDDIYFNIILPIAMRSTTVHMGTESNDWQITNSDGSHQSGFTLTDLSVSSNASISTLAIRAHKTSHGLTDAYIGLWTVNNYVDGEIY